jgi:hypothetical protein
MQMLSRQIHSHRWVSRSGSDHGFMMRAAERNPGPRQTPFALAAHIRGSSVLVIHRAASTSDMPEGYFPSIPTMNSPLQFSNAHYEEDSFERGRPALVMPL